MKEVRTFKYEKKNDQKTFDICGKDFSVKKSEKNKILVGGRKKKRFYGPHLPVIMSTLLK